MDESASATSVTRSAQAKPVKYAIGRVIRSSNEPHEVTVIISLNPEHFNYNDMVKLGSQLKRDFADERLIRAEILDDANIADNYVPAGDMYRLFNKAKRGVYLLNRSTGKEYVQFSTARGKPINEIKVDLGKDSSIKTYPVKPAVDIVSQDEDVYNSVPRDLRPNLIQRLNLFLSLRRSESWGSFYELLSEKSVRGRTRTQIIEDYTRYPGVAGTGRKLLEFSAKAANPDSNAREQWVIAGCASLRGVRVPVDAFVIALRENNVWRFTDINMATPRDTAFVPCGFPVSAQRRRER